MEFQEIYLDNAATTRMEPSVLDAMMPFLQERFGNPSSRHRLGLDARRALKEARERCGGLLGADPKGVVFTASGSEANNLLIRGLTSRLKNRTVLTTRLEHPSVAEPLKIVERHGARVRILRNDSKGRIDPKHLKDRLAEGNCGLICLIHGSNEVGTVQDMRQLGPLIKEADPNTWIHLDAVQTAGHLPLDPASWKVDSLTLSFHKLHGPRGAGLLVLYQDQMLHPIVAGGGQEGGRRSGTENVAAVVGAARALELAVDSLAPARAEMSRLRDLLADGIVKRIPDAAINGSPFDGVPHILSVSFKGVLGEVLLHHLEEKGVLVSTGSACHSRWKDLSETLKALGIPPAYARGTIRFSLSRFTREDEILRVLGIVEDRVRYLREVGLS